MTPDPQLPDRLPSAYGEEQTLDLIAAIAALLFANGQTTERIVQAVEDLGQALGHPAVIYPRWGEIGLRIGSGTASLSTVVAVAPLGVDMGRVAAATNLTDQLLAGAIAPADAFTAQQAIARSPPAATMRFAIMAGLGAAALGVIFGTTHPLSLFLIGLSAVLGGLLRRGLAEVSHNPFLQPLAAALLAGLVGAFAVHAQLSTAQRLIAVCPCMVLVPGPHLLNGALDLVRARIVLGASRLIYAGLIILMICTGLVGGLALGGEALPASAASQGAPLLWDVFAAGVATAAYGTFFSMPWRMLPIPILIGMGSHAARWMVMSMAGGSAEIGVLVACLLAGIVVTPIADRLRLPFAALAFAAVVSLIPGVYFFRIGGGVTALVAAADGAPAVLLGSIASDGANAMLILLGMAFGLICPKMVIERLQPRPAHVERPPATVDRRPDT